MDTQHACYHLVPPPKDHPDKDWLCEVCDFRGTMAEAVKHVTENQYVVQ